MVLTSIPLDLLPQSAMSYELLLLLLIAVVVSDARGRVFVVCKAYFHNFLIYQLIIEILVNQKLIKPARCK